MKKVKEFFCYVAIFVAFAFAFICVWLWTGYKNHSYEHPKCYVEHESFKDFMVCHYGWKE